MNRFTLLLLALNCISGLVQAAPVTEQRLLDAAKDPANWLSHGRDYAEQRFSPLKQVEQNNVARLGLAWSFDMETKRGLEGTPLVIDGVMYVTGAWNMVYAFDAANGRELWRFDPEVPRSVAWKACCDTVNRGLAAWGDYLYLGTLDGRLIALDARHGKPVWSAQTTDPNKPYAITGAPRVVRGKVIIGNAGAEFGVRGYVTAYDASSGKQRWRFYTVPGNPANGFEDAAQAMAAKTWTGEWWKYGGGGTVWDSMSYDPGLNLLYIGVGNGSPHNRHIRSPGGGDNLFLSSIVALDPDTGKYVWHYQETPAESWDYTATQQITIATIAWQGQPRKVLLHAPKNGFFFVIDAASGKLLSAEKFAPAVWASHYDTSTGRPVETPNADYQKEAPIMPSPLGAHNWQSMAYNPDSGLVYIPVQQFSIRLVAKTKMAIWPKSFNLGNESAALPPDNYLFVQAMTREIQKGYLKAWDPRSQKEVWRVAYPYLGNGGVMATAGGLVFQGDVEGRFHAYAAESGKELWRFQTPSSVIAAPISYSVGGEQYVAVLSGAGGAALMTMGMQFSLAGQNGRLLVFKLDGKAELPPPVPAEPIPEPPAAIGLSDAQRQAGKQLFMDHCMRCHGANAVSNGGVTDLRRLAPQWHQNFNQVVLGGLMANAGMPPFNDVLNDEDVNNIHGWVIELAHQDKAIRDAPAWITGTKTWFYGLAAKLIVWVSNLGVDDGKSAATRI